MAYFFIYTPQTFLFMINQNSLHNTLNTHNNRLNRCFIKKSTFEHWISRQPPNHLKTIQSPHQQYTNVAASSARSEKILKMKSPSSLGSKVDGTMTYSPGDILWWSDTCLCVLGRVERLRLFLRLNLVHMNQYSLLSYSVHLSFDVYIDLIIAQAMPPSC